LERARLAERVGDLDEDERALLGLGLRVVEERARARLERGEPGGRAERRLLLGLREEVARDAEEVRARARARRDDGAGEALALEGEAGGVRRDHGVARDAGDGARGDDGDLVLGARAAVRRTLGLGAARLKPHLE